MTTALRARRVIRLYRTMTYFADRLELSAACWRAEKIGIKYTDDERALVDKASQLFWQARDIMHGVYSKRIGKLIADDIMNPRWTR